MGRRNIVKEEHGDMAIRAKAGPQSTCLGIEHRFLRHRKTHSHIWILVRERECGLLSSNLHVVHANFSKARENARGARRTRHKRVHNGARYPYRPNAIVRMMERRVVTPGLNGK